MQCVAVCSNQNDTLAAHTFSRVAGGFVMSSDGHAVIAHLSCTVVTRRGCVGIIMLAATSSKVSWFLSLADAYSISSTANQSPFLVLEKARNIVSV